MKLLKKGNVAGIQVFIMGIVGVAVILAVGLIVLQELSTSAKSGGTATAASNATDTIITKMSNVPTWIGILITVALAFIVLGYFYMKQ
jgi:hypothetical protein